MHKRDATTINTAEAAEHAPRKRKFTRFARPAASAAPAATTPPADPPSATTVSASSSTSSAMAAATTAVDTPAVAADSQLATSTTSIPGNDLLTVTTVLEGGPAPPAISRRPPRKQGKGKDMAKFKFKGKGKPAWKNTRFSPDPVAPGMEAFPEETDPLAAPGSQAIRITVVGHKDNIAARDADSTPYDPIHGGPTLRVASEPEEMDFSAMLKHHLTQTSPPAPAEAVSKNPRNSSGPKKGPKEKLPSGEKKIYESGEIVPCGSWMTEGYCEHGDDCHYSHDLPPGMCKEGPPCHLFLNRGWCPRGNTCKFSHEVTLKPQHVVPGSIKALCRFHSSGSCAQGRWCAFSHDLSLVGCRFYARGACLSGNECRYSHEADKIAKITKVMQGEETAEPQADSPHPVEDLDATVQQAEPQAEAHVEAEAEYTPDPAPAPAPAPALAPAPAPQTQDRPLTLYPAVPVPQPSEFDYVPRQNV